MTIQQVSGQEAFADEGNGSNTFITASFPSAPTEGNIMIGTCSTNDGSFTIPTGWTLAVDNYNATDDDAQKIFYRIVQSGDGVDVTCTAFAGNTKHFRIAEYSGVLTSSPLDAAVSSSVSNSVTTKETGSTGTLAQADELAVAVLSVRATISNPAVDGGFTITGTGLQAFSTVMARNIVSVNDALNPSFSWTTAGNAWCAIATFKAAPSGIGPIFMGS